MTRDDKNSISANGGFLGKCKSIPPAADHIEWIPEFGLNL